MDLVQQGNAESVSRNRGIARGRVGIALLIVGAALCVSITGWLLVANAGVGTATSAGAGADPFTQAAAIEFRGTEHVLTGAWATDQFTGPAAIEFRRIEHEGTGASAADPFTGPAAIAFREGEHEASR